MTTAQNKRAYFSFKENLRAHKDCSNFSLSTILFSPHRVFDDVFVLQKLDDQTFNNGQQLSQSLPAAKANAPTVVMSEFRTPKLKHVRFAQNSYRRFPLSMSGAMCPLPYRAGDKAFSDGYWARLNLRFDGRAHKS